MTDNRFWHRAMHTMRAVAPMFLALALPAQPSSAPQSESAASVLNPADYRHYVDTFRQQEREATGKLYEGEDG